MPHLVASDQGLHCLPVTLLSGSSKNTLECFFFFFFFFSFCKYDA